jgi:hypothetical protein
MGVGEGRQQIVGNLVTEILVLVLVAVLEDERPTIRKCRLSRRNFLDENEVVTSISPSRTTTSARTKKESSLILQPRFWITRCTAALHRGLPASGQRSAKQSKQDHEEDQSKAKYRP